MLSFYQCLLELLYNYKWPIIKIWAPLAKLLIKSLLSCHFIFRNSHNIWRYQYIQSHSTKETQKCLCQIQASCFPIKHVIGCYLFDYLANKIVGFDCFDRILKKKYDLEAISCRPKVNCLDARRFFAHLSGR